MISRIIDYSVRHQGVVFLACLLGCICGYLAMERMPLDALPQLGPTQVIIYSRWDRSPEEIEHQVTFPLVTAMLGTPKVKSVRGLSDYGSSFVYLVFEDGTDPYWARSRTMEYLSPVRDQLPEGVKTEIGPDASSLGWVFQYALVDTSGRASSSQLRTYQDWYLRRYLQSVPGVAEVASVGGQTRQYQVNVNPEKLAYYGVPLSHVLRAVRESNVEASGRMIDSGGVEYMIRGQGGLNGVEDLKEIALTASTEGVPIRVQDVAAVTVGPDIRRGVADLNGTGEVVAGIVIIRSGENALAVIDRVKSKLDEVASSMPAGYKVLPVYDRSTLVHATVRNTSVTLFQIILAVVVIILLFLRHCPSAIVPLVTLPCAVLISFIPLALAGVSINVMSLAGIAIAIGELIDASIVIVEQTQKRLEEAASSCSTVSQADMVLNALREITRPTFLALLAIAVSFLPVFVLEGEEGQVFKPLAWAKICALLVAAVLALTLDPALRMRFAQMNRWAAGPTWLRGLVARAFGERVFPQEENRFARFLIAVYDPVVRWVLRRRWEVIIAAGALALCSIPLYLSLGSEFLPSMDEGTILYMPTTAPGISIGEAGRILRATDAVLIGFPEVDQVLGKAGRADTATDPASLSMLETMIILKPRKAWPEKVTWYSSWAPMWLKPVFRLVTPDRKTQKDLVQEMDQALKVPGMVNLWTYPIRGRADMLSNGVRTAVALKITGTDLATIDALSAQAQTVLRQISGARGVYAEQVMQGHFLNVEWNRQELARYGLSVADAQETVSNAIGGENLTTVLTGSERIPVNVRYMRDFRDTADAINQMISVGASGHALPIRELGRIHADRGPAMIRDEDGLLTSYVFVDFDGRDPAGFITEANQRLHSAIPLASGFAFSWSGQYAAMERSRKRLLVAVPLALLIVLVLIRFNTRSWVKTGIVTLAVPFSAIGAIGLLWLLHYNLSVAVWIGLIGLLSIDAETGVFMLLYLDLAYAEASRAGRLQTRADLHDAIREGAVRRVRPKFMTFATTCLGLIPIMWSDAPGCEIMKRIAAPMIGGIFTSFLLELIVYPAIYEIWRGRSLPFGWTIDPDDHPHELSEELQLSALG